MDTNRRFVLKSIALSGMAGLTIGGPIRALAGTADMADEISVDQPALALVSESVAASLFLHGAMAASGSQLRVQKASQDLGFMLDFERQLRSGQPQRIIGLLDDAAATLVVDLARSAGARIQWLGQHTAQGGVTRHHLLTTDIAAGCIRQLSHQLQACGAAFSLYQARLHGTAPHQLAEHSHTTGQSAQWASALGYALASLGKHTSAGAPFAAAANTPITGSFVSFSIQA